PRHRARRCSRRRRRRPRMMTLGTRGPEMGMLEPPVTELLRPWLARQRWYTSKGRDPDLRAVTTLRAAAPASGVGLEIALVRDVAAVPPVLYQVPLTSRGEPLAGAENALVGRVEDSELGERWIYDGCQDPDGA